MAKRKPKYTNVNVRMPIKIADALFILVDAAFLLTNADHKFYGKGGKSSHKIATLKRRIRKLLRKKA